MEPDEKIDEEIIEIADSYGLDNDQAEEVRDLRDELGIDEDDAYEIWEAM